LWRHTFLFSQIFLKDRAQQDFSCQALVFFVPIFDVSIDGANFGTFYPWPHGRPLSFGFSWSLVLQGTPYHLGFF
jgi:hypothetical protein